ncbi:NAD(P)H-binding protein [Pseudomonas sp. PA27(2017)]|uniref:NAD(P)H-binding protein n=1 Tax=Pseudomonas sp. PA27(2017) TaxID=1932112 RepID=UPI0009611899|nr:NAD(P)H-binding protein [Pseudomonas sp. PA27(2017)]OLU35570.1 hypothetical protein BVH06_02675 [Pseudomonas sp. PA27(2017)]
MSDLSPIEKIALYGAPDRITDALQDVLLERGLQVVVIVDDPTDIAARPGLAAKSGTLFNADSVARSVVGTDAVIVVLNSRSLHIGGFERSYDAIIALLEGLPTARVERLMLIGEHGWLDRDDGLPTEKLEHLQHSLHKSPLAWTLVDAPGREPGGPLKNVGEAASARQKEAKKRSLQAVNEHFEPAFNAAMATQVVFQQPANAFMTLQHYACSVIDQCLQGTSVKQRLHVDSRPQAEEAP